MKQTNEVNNVSKAYISKEVKNILLKTIDFSDLDKF